MSAESGANGKAWRGGLRAAKPLGNNSSSRELSAERGGLNGRGKGFVKNGLGSNLGGKGRDPNASWRAKPTEMDEAAPSPFSAFGGTPSSFGTPAFIGGQSRDPFGGPSMATEASAFASTSSALFTSTPPTPSNQISTLEVLGEDTESRKKRFESTLANNRYLELKPLREAQRLLDIKNGQIPDPLKPRRLDEAMDFLGTCEDMCPEWEREEREYQKAVDAWERYPGTNRIDPSRAVKAFHRPAAGNDQPLPSDVRPPHILKKTLDYLFHTLLPSQPLYLTHPFLRDRTRAIRQDFTMQNDRGALAIECNERIARYHILALGTLREHSTFSESQELEQLRKVLKSLNEFYDDARLYYPPIPTPNEAEFRAYNLLTHLRDPDIIWSTELLPEHIFLAPLLQTAISLHSLAQRSNLPRGERASPNAFSRFFKLIATKEVPYLFACLLSSHFGEIRRHALDTLRKAYVSQHSLFPARSLANILGCDDEEEVVGMCETVGLEVKVSDSGKVLVDLHKGVSMGSSVPKARVSKRLVEAKRGATTYQAVIDAGSYISGEVISIPTTPSLASFPQIRRMSSQQSSRIATNPTSIPALPATAPQASPFISRPTFSLPTQQPIPLPFAQRPSFLPPNTSIFNSPIITPVPTPIPTPPLPQLSAAASSFLPSAVAPVAPTLQSYGTLPFSPTPVTFQIPAPLSHPPLPSASASKTQAPLSQSPLPHVHLPGIKKVSEPLPLPSPDLRGPARDRYTSSLVASLLSSLISSAISHPIQRAAETALKDRWLRIRSGQRETRKKVVDMQTSGLVDFMIHRGAGNLLRRIVIEERRVRELRRAALTRWMLRLKERIARTERHRRFDEVSREIGLGPMRLDDAMVEDLDFGSLTIGKKVGFRDAEVDFSITQALQAALSTRRSLWAPDTFRDIVSNRLDDAFTQLRISTRPTYTCIISVPSLQSDPFSSWLSCKFGLDEEDLTSYVETPAVDVEFRMVDQVDDATMDVDSAGLVLFYHSMKNALPSELVIAQERLQANVRIMEKHSIYPPIALIMVCPDSSLETKAAEKLRAEVAEQLRFKSLPNNVTLRVLFISVENAEIYFKDEITTHVSDIRINPERVKRPLLDLVSPLLSLWSALLLKKTAPHADCRSILLPELFDAFVEVLNQIQADAGTRADPESMLDPMHFPSLRNLRQGTLRADLEAYIRLPGFASSGHFPVVESALNSRPPTSETVLIRLLLESLAEFGSRQLIDGTIRQGTIDKHLIIELARVETLLDLAENKWLVEDRKEKKRKASTSPVEIFVAQTSKKHREEATGMSRLKALNLLMRQTEALLS